MKDERVKQVLIAAALLAGLTGGAVALLLGWRTVPGVLGEWLGMVVGIMSTPFFLEASFVILGVLVVMVVNAVRRHREGDEFVALGDLPDHHTPPATANQPSTNQPSTNQPSANAAAPPKPKPKA
jgi:hypothetical protein